MAGTEVIVENPVDTVKLEVYVADCEVSVLFDKEGVAEVAWLLVIDSDGVTEVNDVLAKMALKIDEIEVLIDAADELGSGG